MRGEDHYDPSVPHIHSSDDSATNQKDRRWMRERLIMWCLFGFNKNNDSLKVFAQRFVPSDTGCPSSTK